MKTSKIVTVNILIALILCFALTTEAQNRSRQGKGNAENRERIEMQKIGYLTEKLDLTVDEAELFWPIYNKHRDKLKEEQTAFKKTLVRDSEEIDQLSDDEAAKSIDAQLVHEQKILDLKKEYLKNLNKALSPQKIVRLIEAEKMFREELVRRVAGRGGNGKGGNVKGGSGQGQNSQGGTGGGDQ